jgi:hypothetical protein
MLPLGGIVPLAFNEVRSPPGKASALEMARHIRFVVSMAKK